MSAPFSFLGNSNVLLDVLTDEGLSTGLQLKGNCPSLSIKTDSERVEQIGTGRDNFGQIIASATFAKPASLTFTLDQVDQDMFAMAFFGTNSVFTQTAGAVPDAPVVTIHDKWVEIGARNISGVTVKNEAGAVTYELGTHYEINPRLGAIRALSTGTITSGQTVHVTYTKAAISSIKMQAMTKTNVRVRLLLDGQNFADGRNFILDIHQARLAPSGDFGFQAGNDKKFMEAQFEATMETPTGGTEPFTLTWLS